MGSNCWVEGAREMPVYGLKTGPCVTVCMFPYISVCFACMGPEPMAVVLTQTIPRWFGILRRNLFGRLMYIT